MFIKYIYICIFACLESILHKGKNKNIKNKHPVYLRQDYSG